MLVANSTNNGSVIPARVAAVREESRVFASGQEERIKAPDTNFNVTGYR
jgi:hypothetical protein